jgi:hypothetical protein
MSNIINNLKTGDNAINFYAKYGNTTPIKFIICIPDNDHPSYVFCPYDLQVIAINTTVKENKYYNITTHSVSYYEIEGVILSN